MALSRKITIEEQDGSDRSPPWASNADFQVRGTGRRKWPYWEAKLWWVLVAFFFTLMTTLALVLTVLWYQDHSRTVTKLDQVYKQSINEFNSSVNAYADDLIQYIQTQIVRRARERIEDYLLHPTMLVGTNFNSVQRDLRLFSSSNLSRNLQLLWMELTESSYTSSSYYADSKGTFAGYLKLSNQEYRAMYRPADSPLGVLCTDLCPTVQGVFPFLKTGHLGIWSVDNQSGSFKEQLSSVAWNFSNEMWYHLAGEAREQRGWTRPFDHKVGIGFAMDYVRGYKVRDRLDMIFGASISLPRLSEFLTMVHRELHDGEAQDEFKSAHTFIVDLNGEMVASSQGFQQVSLANSTDHRRTWKQVPDPSVHAALTSLNVHEGARLGRPEEVLNTTQQGSRVVFEEGDYMCAYWTKRFDEMDLSFAAVDWIIVSVLRKEAYISGLQEELDKVDLTVAEKQRETTRELAADTQHTTIISVVLTLLGGALMACVARAITLPIRRISKEMHSIAELKFMTRDNPEDDLDMIRQMSGLVTDNNSDIVDGSSVDSEGSSSDDDEEQIKVKSGLRRSRCRRLPCTPVIAELREMREAFSSMSAGLQSFAKYVDPHVVELLVRGRAEARLGVEKADVTVFFSDIAGFTTMGENLAPETFMNLLSEYLEEMSNIIMSSQGVVGEFIGDGIMAWWNTPQVIERHTVQALNAALGQQKRLDTLRRHWCGMGLPEVRVRMGLTRGMVLAGNVGSRRRMKFGLVGDVVNLASRLEALCKRYGVYMLVDASVVNAPEVQETFLFRPLDLVVVKGRKGTTELFELVDKRAHAGPAVLSFVDDFSHALKLYRGGDAASAYSALQAYKRRWPKDRPTDMLLDRCKLLLANPPGPDWSPVETLADK